MRQEVDTDLFKNFGLQIVKNGHKTVLKHLIVKEYHIHKCSKTEPIRKILWFLAKLNYIFLTKRGIGLYFLSTCNNVLC